MKETILYYNVPSVVQDYLNQLSKQLGLNLKELTNDDASQRLGYLLSLEGFKENKEESSLDDIPFLYFAFMSENQLDIMLEILRQAKLPPLPYKAMMTENNINMTLNELLKEIQEEHAMMTKAK